MSGIVLTGITKTFGKDVVAVDDVTLTIERGEVMAIVGPSGCGKTTLLRMIAGLEEVTKGSIAIDGRDVTRLDPRDRDIAMVFQNYALYPHMNVRQNLGYGLRMRKTPKDEVRRRVAETARLLGLEDLLDRRPTALSGGQRQRVAMGRAIVREPAAFLMDEPLSNLDAKLRVSMRAELSRLHERLGVTTVYVTHDQTEAMTLGQRAVVMRDGQVQQVGEPQALYREPANLFVASFIGSPAMNLVEATVEDGNVSFGGLTFPVAADQRSRLASRKRIIVGIRPEAFEGVDFARPGLPQLDAHVAVLEELGSDAHIIFPVKAPHVEIAGLTAPQEDEVEDRVFGSEETLFNARVDPRTPARRGSTVRLAVDIGSFYFFDPDTGESLLSS